MHTLFLKLYNQFYMNILYEIVCKNVHTFMKKNIWTPRVFLIFFTFFERILYKSNCIIFIFSWYATHTKIKSKLVVIVTAGSQKITLWGPQRTPLGILRVNVSNFVVCMFRRSECELSFQMVSEVISCAAVWCYLILVLLLFGNKRYSCIFCRNLPLETYIKIYIWKYM